MESLKRSIVMAALGLGWQFHGTYMKLWKSSHACIYNFIALLDILAMKVAIDHTSNPDHAPSLKNDAPSRTLPDCSQPTVCTISSCEGGPEIPKDYSLHTGVWGGCSLIWFGSVHEARWSLFALSYSSKSGKPWWILRVSVRVWGVAMWARVNPPPPKYMGCYFGVSTTLRQ